MKPTNPTFLYIEDDLSSRRVIEILLKDLMGFSNLTMLDNTADLLEKLHSLSAVPDVIFLDIKMRPHDGYEVLAMLKSEPVYGKLAVIALTANVTAHDVRQLKQAGFSGLIAKPILKEVFPELVKKILAGEPVWYIP